MQRPFLSALVAAVAVSAQCEIPDEGPLSDTITEPFGLIVHSPEWPIVHNRYMNLYESGGGDQHLYLSPAGEYAFDLVLSGGVIEQDGLYAVINGEYLVTDNTTKLFMTERGDPRAIFQPVYGCNPDTDELQVELEFVERRGEGDVPGGHICVRSASGERHEFRWSPHENPAWDDERPCMPVTLVVDRSEPPPMPTPSGNSTVIPSPTGPSGPTATPDLFADVTSEGFAFVGCAPEEGPAGDGIPGRTLDGELYADDDLTNELCVQYCGSRGYIYAGSEYSRECWCGNSFLPTRQPNNTIDDLAGCNMRCGGDDGQWCGGAGWMSLYEACVEDEPCVNAVFVPAV
ncbi:hypothetical protein ACRALDRAFT_1064452 [Sodiomyces alcalophilus JCM 7366]|uniref:uncharacterized protein n=1 Tax=Sodiomyces alcalophilus JCM 7366 TaxID=591952 RepID=UPI0039B5290B